MGREAWAAVIELVLFNDNFKDVALHGALLTLDRSTLANRNGPLRCVGIFSSLFRGARQTEISYGE
jgi:hypothetical protein